MAIRDDNSPPRTPGSITQTADSQQSRINNISNVSKTVSNMQQDVKQRITETKDTVKDSDSISSVQNSMNKVLSKLSGTIDALSTGVKTITVDTAAATKDAIGQYGKAISEDISFNKQNIVTMALARSTPIYGYFIAKFMETDVWKSAVGRMKASIGRVFGSVSNLFRKTPKEPAPGRGKIPAAGKIPHMQKGGYVEKGGYARIHAAEVVMPIEKVLSRIDQTISVTKNLSKIAAKQQLEATVSSKAIRGLILTKEEREELKGGKKRRRAGLFKDFLKIWREEKTKKGEDLPTQQLRALLAIQDSLGAKLDSWPQMWTRLLLRHPAFRTMVLAGKYLGRLVGLVSWKPLYSGFKTRGGYGSYLSKSGQPLTALNRNVGLTFVESMWRYDNMLNLLKAIAIATRDTASAITGKAYRRLAGVGTGQWSIAGGVAKIVRLAGGAAGLGIAKLIGSEFLEKDARKTIQRARLGRRANRYSIGENEGGQATRIGLGSERQPMFVQDVSILKIEDKFQRVYTAIADRMPKEIKERKRLVDANEEQAKTMGKIKRNLTGNRLIKTLMLAGGVLKFLLYDTFAFALRPLMKLVLKTLGISQAGKWMAGKGIYGLLTKKRVGPGILSRIGTFFGKGGTFRTSFSKVFGKSGMLVNTFGKEGHLSRAISGVFGKGGMISKVIGLGSPLRTSLANTFGKGGHLSRGISSVFGKEGMLAKTFGKGGTLRTSMMNFFGKGGTLHNFLGKGGTLRTSVMNFFGKGGTLHNFLGKGGILRTSMMNFFGKGGTLHNFLGKGGALRTSMMNFFGKGGTLHGFLGKGGALRTSLMSFLGKGGILRTSLMGFFGKGGIMRASVMAIFGKGGALASALSGLWSAAGPFVGAIGVGLKAVLTSPTLWAGLAAAGIGVAIGTAINKWLIKPIIEKQHKKQLESTKLSEKINKVRQKELIKKRGASDLKTRYLTKRKQDIIGFQRGLKDERDKSLHGRFLSEHYIAQITEAQQRFIGDNETIYLQYDVDEIRSLRKDWYEKQPFRKRRIREDVEKYGRERESSFLKYLQKHGVKVTDQFLQSRSKAWGREMGIAVPTPKEPTAAKGISGLAKIPEKVKAKASDWWKSLDSKSRAAFETAKKYYVGQLGLTEAQADQILMAIATQAGDRLSMISDPKILKEAGSGIMAEITEKVPGAIDKGKIAVNNAILELSSSDALGGVIKKALKEHAEEVVESTKEFGNTMGAGIMYGVNNIITTVQSSNSSMSTGGGGGGKMPYTDDKYQYATLTGRGVE